ncbi:4-alpha-glucanotransferase [Candidatus Parcubacteria bacterium]|nr:MAG: 4-alpha-glucanotransferase [Candidatus Parcubacteria bacterium]
MQTQKPRVLMFGWEFPPYNSGGLGVACYGLTRSLVKEGADVCFVLPKNLGNPHRFLDMRFADNTDFSSLYDQMTVKELEVFLYPYLNEETYHSKEELLKILREKGYAPYASDLYSEVLRYGALSREIAKTEKHDVIHAHDWLSFPAGIEAKKVSGKPLITHVHATEFDRTGHQGTNQKIADIEYAGLQAADKVVAVSQLTKNTITKKYGINEAKVEVVHNGIDEDYYKQKVILDNKLANLKRDGSKVVLFLGRITIQKGPDYFIRMAKKVLEHEPKVYFLVAGSGDMEKYIMRQAAELKISDRVLFIGWLKGDDQAHAYQISDLFVMPSVSEPFGLVPLEAMINNTPVLISKQSGVAEVTRNVLKADFWDTDEMANKILSVLAYSSLNSQLINYGREEVKNINWGKAARKCLGIYNKMILNPT